MEILRIGHDEWGRRLVEGVSWDLLAVAAGIGAVVIVGHIIYSLIRGQTRDKGGA
jgi:hypothetical protein